MAGSNGFSDAIRFRRPMGPADLAIRREHFRLTEDWGIPGIQGSGAFGRPMGPADLAIRREHFITTENLLP